MLKQGDITAEHVVSAMGKSTDDLLRLAHDVSENPSGRELDIPPSALVPKTLVKQ